MDRIHGGMKRLEFSGNHGCCGPPGCITTPRKFCGDSGSLLSAKWENFLPKLFSRNMWKILKCSWGPRRKQKCNKKSGRLQSVSAASLLQDHMVSRHLKLPEIKAQLCHLLLIAMWLWEAPYPPSASVPSFLK